MTKLFLLLIPLGCIISGTTARNGKWQNSRQNTLEFSFYRLIDGLFVPETCDDGSLPIVIPKSMMTCTSSQTSQTPGNWACENTINGKPLRGSNQRAWAVEKNKGVGEYIEFKFSRPVLVKIVKIMQRFYYFENARRVSFMFDGNTKTTEDAELEITTPMDWNTKRLNHYLPTQSLRITIEEMTTNKISSQSFWGGFKQIQFIGCPEF